MMCFFQHFICNVWILCHIMFFILFYFLLFVIFVMFEFYIKERKRKTEKWGRGVNCEEEMREKNEMGEGGCMCVVGEKEKERQGCRWVWGKKKKGNKKEKRNGEWGLRVW
jgi:hypothetical protein